jgi:hypothetical protein
MKCFGNGKKVTNYPLAKFKCTCRNDNGGIKVILQHEEHRICNPDSHIKQLFK